MLDDFNNTEQIFVFGDSLSDTGNIRNMSGDDLAPFYPTGEHIIGQTSNGLSNGDLWIDKLSEYLELNPRPLTEFTGIVGDGINFAIAGANSDDSNYNPNLRLNPLDSNGAGLTEQVEVFDSLTGLINGQVSNPNQSLYTMWIGANDYLSYILNDPEGRNPIQQVKYTVNNISNALKDIINIATELGDENPTIMVFNLPDLTLTPLAQNLTIKEQKTLDRLIEQHNQLLEKELRKLGKSYSNVNFIDLDIATEFERILQDVSITNNTEGATQTDIYHGQFDDSLTTPEGLNEALEKGESYFFWDSVHPTTLVHSMIGDYVIESLNKWEDYTFYQTISSLKISKPDHKLELKYDQVLETKLLKKAA